MSLKKSKISESRIFKKRLEKKKKDLTQRAFLQSQLFASNKDTKSVVNFQAEEVVKYNYKPLQYSKKASTNESKHYVPLNLDNENVTIISETEFEDEGEEYNGQLSMEKKETMAELFKPKVKLTETINLCFNSDREI